MDAFLATARLYVTTYPEIVFGTMVALFLIGCLKGSPMALGVSVAGAFMAYILMGGF